METDKLEEGYIPVHRTSETSVPVSKKKGWIPLLTILVPIVYWLSYMKDISPPIGCLPFRQKSLEERAREILSNNPLIDGHNDLAIQIRSSYHNHIYQENFTKPFERGGFPKQVDLPRLTEGQYGGAFWSLFYLCPYDPYDFSTSTYDPIVRATLEQLDLFHRLGAVYPDHFTPTKSAHEARMRFKSNKFISPYAIEGLHQIGNRASNLRLYHQLGVRYATLTWNCHNIYADSATTMYLSNWTNVRSKPYWGGLSTHGKKLIREMNRLGMIVDLAHVSKDTMIDVLVGKENLSVDGNDIDAIEALDPNSAWHGSLAPPIFSHSSAYALCPHPRNVPDSVLKLVKKRNTLVMVNFNPEFISCTPPPGDSPRALPPVYQPNNTLHQVARHITYIGDLIGYDHVGIGTDFDGISDTPRGLEDVSKFPDLIVELLRMGVSDEDAGKIVGRNLLRVWDDVDRVSARLQVGGMKPLEDDIEVSPGTGKGIDLTQV